MIYLKGSEFKKEISSLEKKEIKTDNIRILGYDFVKNNKNKAKLIISNKKFKLREFLSGEGYHDNELKLKIILDKDLLNLNYMFGDCKRLINFSIYDNKLYIDDEIINGVSQKLEKFIEEHEYSNDDSKRTRSGNTNDNKITSKIESQENFNSSIITEIHDNIRSNKCKSYYGISHVFYNCISLSSISGISNWNVDNAIDMKKIFSYCEKLSSLPDISKWNTGKVEDMSLMFDNCSSLISLPDISKWNTDNVNDMSEMFSNCISLISLPDISKWNTNNVINMSGMFSHCSSISSLPDIS